MIKEDTEVRSKIMARVHSKNTKPELLVRKILFSLGYRYRLHVKNMPGSPDIVFLGKNKVIFVHGCFWHRHSCLRGRKTPKSNKEYWEKKFHRNTRRDENNNETLKINGWEILIIWECWLNNVEKVQSRLVEFLER